MRGGPGRDGGERGRSESQPASPLQIVSDDIEVIEDTIPKLEAFYSSYNELSTEVDGLLEKIASFSVSAISSEGLESKSQELQLLEEAVSQRRSKLEDILASCELLETPFDHSKFEKNVSDLQEKMALCDKVHYHCLQPQRALIIHSSTHVQTIIVFPPPTGSC